MAGGEGGGEGCREERREGGRPESGREAGRQGDTGRQARRQAGRRRIQEGEHDACCHGLSKCRNKTCMLPGCRRMLWRASMPLHSRRLLLLRCRRRPRTLSPPSPRERERERECVCVCEREREREREFIKSSHNEHGVHCKATGTAIRVSGDNGKNRNVVGRQIIDIGRCLLFLCNCLETPFLLLLLFLPLFFLLLLASHKAENSTRQNTLGFRHSAAPCQPNFVKAAC